MNNYGAITYSPIIIKGDNMTHNKNHERRKAYPGIGYVGSNRLSGLYGVNNGIIDSKGTGIMHLFYNQYDKDFVHSGCTLIKVDDDIYYGNKNEKKIRTSNTSCTN